MTSTTNRVWHGWLKQEWTTLLDSLPQPTIEFDPEAHRAFWASWRQGLSHPVHLPADLPPLRMLLVLDNLAGHKTAAFVQWLIAHGILPRDTPLGGSWLNMTESVQRILIRRALDSQHPTAPQEIIDWLEATARGWKAHPTPVVWAGKRLQRRQPAYARRHPLGGSAAVTKRPLRWRFKPVNPERGSSTLNGRWMNTGFDPIPQQV